MKILSIRRVGGVILGGCVLLLPHPVASLAPPSAPCPNSESCFSQFIEELEKPGNGLGGSLSPAILYNQIISANKDPMLAKRIRFRYGHWLKEIAPLEAIPLLQHALHDYPLLGDYLTFWLGQAYARAGLEKEAAEAFQRVRNQFPNSLLLSESLYAAGDMLVKIRDWESAPSMLSQGLSEEPRHPKAANALFHMGTCADQLGEREKAIKFFRELWWKFPLAPESAQAERWLRQELGALFLPSLEEQYQRGMAYYDGGALEDAIQEFQRYISLSSPTPTLLQVQYKLAMALVRLKRYDQAEATLTHLARSKYPKKNDAWVWLGRVYLRQGKGQQLENLLSILSDETLSGDQQSLLLTFYGIWLEDHSRWEEAGKTYKRAALAAHTLTQRLDTLWRVGWILYQQEQFVEAADLFREIIKAVGKPKSDNSLHAASQAIYWLARSQEHLGQMELSREHLKQLREDYPFTYYGQLAEIRLGSTEVPTRRWAVLASTDSIPVVSPDLQQNIHYQKVQELRALRLFKEAVQELEVVFTGYGADSQGFLQLVFLASEIGAYDIGIRLAIRHYGWMLRKGQLPISSPAWLGAFPMGYKGVIQSYAPKHVDPFLVAGLIREESLYSPHVVSQVGAIGLMQLMPATAERVARQLGWQDSNFDSQALFVPQHNIQLGTYYLGQLLQEFQNNIVYSVAAYNAGPQAVKRWIAQNGQRDPDEFVELIGYRETRGYVKRVVGSYRIYRMLFGEMCGDVSLDRFC